MATDELTMSELQAHLDAVAAKPNVRDAEPQVQGDAAIPVAGVLGRLLARMAIAVVLAVCGSALVLAVIGILDAAPLAVFAAVIVASWVSAGRIAGELDPG
jgi:hypothetical protein